MELGTQDLSVVFGPHPALDRVTVSFPPGSLVYLGGRAGAGKTTLLKSLAGLIRPDSGSVRWDGVSIDLRDEARLARGHARLGMVFQTDALFDSLSVLDNVRLPLRRRGVREDEATARARDALEAVGLLDAADNRPEHLSGGMKKRAGIARAVVARPEVLLCDEPLAGLDPGTAAQICALLDHLAEARTLLFCAAEPPEQLAFPRWVWLARGRISHDGPPRPDLLEVDDEPVAAEGAAR